MALDFIKFGKEGDQFIKSLAEELGHPRDKERAGRVLQSVLHALRNRLTVAESLQLISQLPMFLKAVYVHNWSLHHKQESIKKISDFEADAWEEDGDVSQFDFPEDGSVKRAFSVIFGLLGNYISPGEMEDIRAVLPKQLKTLLDNPQITRKYGFK